MSLLGDIGNVVGYGSGISEYGNALGDAFSNITGIGKSAASNNYSNVFGGSGTQSSLPSYQAPAKQAALPTPPAYQIDPGVQAQVDALNRQTAALQAQTAAAPKLIYRDTNAAWQSAQNSAAASVNPVYQDYLNQFVTKQQNSLSQQQATDAAAKQQADTTLQQTNEDIATNRQRTAEDTASAIAQNQQKEGAWQTQEGTQAAQQEEAARLALGDQGIEGRGAGQLQQSQMDRNAASNTQTQQFQNQRDTANQLATRTYQDLDTKGTRATEMDTTQKADLDRTLNDFITNQGTDLTGFQSTNESARLSALFNATQQNYQTSNAAWLASLVQGGARPQDVALAAQVYK